MLYAASDVEVCGVPCAASDAAPCAALYEAVCALPASGEHLLLADHLLSCQH